jgi:acetoin utilization deacetylase AcuC-like enzyme
LTGIYTDPRCLEHFAPGHPERPDRVRAAEDALRLFADGEPYGWPAVNPADLPLITAVHSERQVRGIVELAKSGGGWVDPDTFVIPASFPAALYAAGATLQAMADVLSGREPNAFVVVRPPGHHAMRDRSMGFCLFNNAAVAAEWAVREGGAQRVAILDIDVHHGNGTQDIFYDRPDILYYSTHQFPFYPGSGRVEETGRHDGAGLTINVPLPAGSGDETYLDVTESILAPALRRFRPDVVLVSVGFDAHWADPLAQMRLTLEGYGAILARIRALTEELCGGKCIFLLEGGYDLDVIAAGARLAGCVLSGMPLPADPLGPAAAAAPPARAAEVIVAVREAHGLPPAPGK